MARACAVFVLSMLVLACVTVNVSSRELLLKGQHDKVGCAACLHLASVSLGVSHFGTVYKPVYLTVQSHVIHLYRASVVVQHMHAY